MMPQRKPVSHHLSTLLRFCFLVHILLVGLSISDAFSIPAPDGLSYFPFQVKAIQECLVRSDRVLLGDEMGLGKTISVIGALNVLEKISEKNSKILIIAPKSVLPNWESELYKWLVGSSSQSIGVITASHGLPPPVDILLMNYDIVEKFRDDIDELGPFDIVVCDEAHYLKNADAVRTQATLGNHYRSGIATQRLWLLTGSPVLNNPIELFPLLRALDPNFQVIPELRSLSAFQDRYCGRQDTPWGVTYKGGKNLAELRGRLKEKREDGTPLMLRRTKVEVLKDLPQKRHQLLPLDDDGKAASEEARVLVQAAASDPLAERNLEELKVVELKSMLKGRGLPVSGSKKELIARLLDADGSLGGISSSSVVDDNIPGLHGTTQSVLRSAPSGSQGKVLHDLLARRKSSNAIMGALSVARHETALRKVPYAIELLETATASHKVVVYAYHRDVLEALFDAFENQAVTFHGGSTVEERAEAVHRFQTDPSVRLFIGSIRVASLGITLTAASHVVFVELDWSPLIVQQAEDRCHRIGQKSSVLVQYIFFRNTIDEYFSQLLASKQSTISATTDEPKGATSWVFDFGKHKGLSVWDVAGTHPAYLKWLVRNGTYQGKEELCKALIELGYLNQNGDENEDTRVVKKPVREDVGNADEQGKIMVFAPAVNANSLGPSESEESPKNKKKTSSDQDPGDCVLTFGKYHGKPLRDVPRGYLYWLRASGAASRNYTLMGALRSYMYKIKSDQKRE
jgi:SWI/SNF-related matrix-associated actin-dependent regulator 1 of chromatin subfamily A